MKKFYILVKKEIRELLTPQMLVPLLAVVLVFNFIGKIIGKEVEKNKVPQPIEIIDMDRSLSSQSVIEIVKKSNFAPNVTSEGKKEEILDKARENGAKAVVIIPQGFERGIQNFQPQKIEVYTIMRNFSVAGARDSGVLAAVLAAINDGLSDQLISQSAPGKDAAVLKRPVAANEFVVVGEKTANVSAAAVSGFIVSQTTFIPIILFLVIVFASQMIATSIASEKENKTLETLLSAPVSRKFIVASKLFAAGFVALITAVVYLFGMRNYMTGMTGGAGISLDGSAKDAIVQLGLQFSTYDYVLLGLCLFFSILAALAISFILGAFAEDTKSAQAVIAPVMILLLVPYLLTMLLDFSSLSPLVRDLIYAIPFSHAFLAAPALLLNQYQNVWLGIAYLAFFFIIAVIFAAKIFSTEKIFTLRLKFKRK